MATVTATTTCNYSNPVTYNGTTPTNMRDLFFFRDSVCTTVDNAATTSLSSSTVGFNPAIATSGATSTDFKIYSYTTGGEILTNLFLFILVVMFLTKWLLNAIDRIKTKRTYLQYGGGDVEIREDL